MAESQWELYVVSISSDFLKGKSWDLTRLVWLLVSPDRSSSATSPSQKYRNCKPWVYLQVIYSANAYVTLFSRFLFLPYDPRLSQST